MVLLLNIWQIYKDRSCQLLGQLLRYDQGNELHDIYCPCKSLPGERIYPNNHVSGTKVFFTIVSYFFEIHDLSVRGMSCGQLCQWCHLSFLSDFQTKDIAWNSERSPLELLPQYDNYVPKEADLLLLNSWRALRTKYFSLFCIHVAIFGTDI